MTLGSEVGLQTRLTPIIVLYSGVAGMLRNW